MIVFDAANMAERYNKRLAIVVPYRDRAEHLRQFVPHLATYFQSDKLDRHIPISLHVVEQSGNAPFNRGRVLNCGYALACDSADYICFHDVDYLPLWADYSWSARPARLAWKGLQLPENPNSFFGGVVLFDKAAFENVNGYPNEYWGWGCEDLELGYRCSLAGLGFDKRDGTYLPLPHPHAGYTAAGARTEEAQRTHALFQKRRGRLADFMTRDGSSNLKFEPLDKRPISIDGNILRTRSTMWLISDDRKPPSPTHRRPTVSIRPVTHLPVRRRSFRSELSMATQSLIPTEMRFSREFT